MATIAAAEALAILAGQSWPAPPATISARASTTSGGAENFAARNAPSAAPTIIVWRHYGSLRHRITATAAAKQVSVASPSTVASEKCATRAGEQVKTASAT